MNILVTGAAGQLGQMFKAIDTDLPRGVKMLFADAQQLDVTNAEAVHAYVEQHEVQALVNCAAYTAVDRAETEQQKAYVLNVEAPKLLAREMEKRKGRLLHFSTDYVFKGDKRNPYTEEDLPNPQSVYGQTKLRGEQEVLAACTNAFVVRTSWLYSPFGKNFFLTMRQLALAGEVPRVVTTQVGTPTYAGHLVQAALQMLLHEKRPIGIWHYSHQGKASWHEFATRIYKVYASCSFIQPMACENYPALAPRPPYSVLSKQKIEKEILLHVPHWHEGLEACVQLTDKLKI